MFTSFVYLSFALTLVDGRSLRRQASAGSGGMQTVPSTAPADNTFSNGAARTNDYPDTAPNDDNGIYGNRDIDLPFGRLYGGNLMFFPLSEENNPTENTDEWTDAKGVDSASQSACGIPHNAYYNSHVAIHPYFLKYAGLDRYCMQDVCISFWKEDWSSDMMLKVTDICSTDENDPTHCATPGDIKIDRSKAKVWDGNGGKPNSAVPNIQGNSFPEKAVWFFMKCWDDGTIQPAYNHPGNWFSQPQYNSNKQWAMDSQQKQAQKNKLSYPGKGFPAYENCAYNSKCQPQDVSDWTKGQEPSWAPIAGGKGYSGVVGSTSNQQTATNSSTDAGTVSGSGSGTGTGSGSGAGTGSGSGTGTGSGSGSGSGAGTGSGSGSGSGSGTGTGSGSGAGTGSGSGTGTGSGSGSGSGAGTGSGSGSGSGSGTGTGSGSGAGTGSGSGAGAVSSTSGTGSSTPSTSSSAPSTSSTTPSTGSTTPGTGSSTPSTDSDAGDDADDGVDYCDEL